VILVRKAILQKSNTKTDIGNNIGNIVDHPIPVSFYFRKIICHHKKKQGGGHIDHDAKNNKEIGRRVYEILVLPVDLFIKVKQTENDKSDGFQRGREGIKILLV
jgi:hypothetical protein